jgi:hypothetical protein
MKRQGNAKEHNNSLDFKKRTLMKCMIKNLKEVLGRWQISDRHQFSVLP